MFRIEKCNQLYSNIGNTQLCYIRYVGLIQGIFISYNEQIKFMFSLSQE